VACRDVVEESTINTPIVVIVSTMAFKRKRVMAPRRGGFKRRRFNRTRRSVRGIGNSKYSSSGAQDYGTFKARRVSRRTYQNRLWNASSMSEHYRSIGAESYATITPASLTTMSVSFTAADDNGIGTPYQVTGGLQNSADDLLYNIVLRGGLMKLTVSNDGAGTPPTQVTIWGIRSVPCVDLTGFPTLTPVKGWDPSIFPDFNRKVGKILVKRTFILGNQDSCSMTMKKTLRKIDTSDWVDGSNRHYWLVAVSNLETAATQSHTVVNSYNLSFCGDKDRV